MHIGSWFLAATSREVVPFCAGVLEDLVGCSLWIRESCLGTSTMTGVRESFGVVSLLGVCLRGWRGFQWVCACFWQSGIFFLCDVTCGWGWWPNIVGSRLTWVRERGGLTSPTGIFVQWTVSFLGAGAISSSLNSTFLPPVLRPLVFTVSHRGRLGL